MTAPRADNVARSVAGVRSRKSGEWSAGTTEFRLPAPGSSPRDPYDSLRWHGTAGEGTGHRRTAARTSGRHLMKNNDAAATLGDAASAPRLENYPNQDEGSMRVFQAARPAPSRPRRAPGRIGLDIPTRKLNLAWGPAVVRRGRWRGPAVPGGALGRRRPLEVARTAVPRRPIRGTGREREKRWLIAVLRRHGIAVRLARLLRVPVAIARHWPSLWQLDRLYI